MGSSMVRLAKSIEGYRVAAAVVHRSQRPGGHLEALYPGVKALTVDRLREALG